MVILLIGLLGSGKTSIATLLAKKLGFVCIELEDYVLDKTPFKTITEAYNNKISIWKETELEATKELSKKDDAVIILGGATVENNLNILYFKENSPDLKIVYLETKPQVLTDRLVHLYDEFKKEGPKLVLKTMEKHYKKRDMLYREYADLVINTEDSTPEEATDEILEKLNK
ncbi:MAG TPA: shikimate kinase [Candidatus Woesebacteria bacterium]|nr:shikimate kinase [Candidatus Woesebacteria bacterium]